MAGRLVHCAVVACLRSATAAAATTAATAAATAAATTAATTIAAAIADEAGAIGLVHTSAARPATHRKRR